MKFDDSGEIRLNTRRYKVAVMIEMDVISDLGLTPKDIVDQIRGGMMFKKTYDGLHIADLVMEYEVHVDDKVIDLLEV